MTSAMDVPPATVKPGWDYAITEVIRVVDGDTVDLRIDLGFHMTAALRFRILNADAPEHREAGWAECTAFTKAWLEKYAGKMRARTQKADSFGRWLAEVYVPTALGWERVLATDLTALMEEHGWTSEAVR